MSPYSRYTVMNDAQKYAKIRSYSERRYPRNGGRHDARRLYYSWCAHSFLRTNQTNYFRNGYTKMHDESWCTSNALAARCGVKELPEAALPCRVVLPQTQSSGVQHNRWRRYSKAAWRHALGRLSSDVAWPTGRPASQAHSPACVVVLVREARLAPWRCTCHALTCRNINTTEINSLQTSPGVCSASMCMQ